MLATAALFCGLTFQLVVSPIHGHGESPGATFEAQTECAFCAALETELALANAVVPPLVCQALARGPLAAPAKPQRSLTRDAPARAPPPFA